MFYYNDEKSGVCQSCQCRKYVKLRIGILQGISFLYGNRGLIINCKN